MHVLAGSGDVHEAACLIVHDSICAKVACEHDPCRMTGCQGPAAQNCEVVTQLATLNRRAVNLSKHPVTHGSTHATDMDLWIPDAPQQAINLISGIATLLSLSW